MNDAATFYLTPTVFQDEGPLTHITPVVSVGMDDSNLEERDPDILPQLLGLDSKRLHELISQARDPGTRELGREIYRLHSVLRRAALLVNTLYDRTGKEALDITSQVLLAGVDQALKKEPAVAEARAWATCLRKGTGGALPEVASQSAVELEPIAAEAARSEEPRQRLFTWKLVPQPGRSHDGWTVSPYRGVAIVRAYDPVHARRLVASKFKSQDNHSSSPWERRSLVRCELVEDPAYDHIKAVAVVYP